MVPPVRVHLRVSSGVWGPRQPQPAEKRSNTRSHTRFMTFANMLQMFVLKTISRRMLHNRTQFA